MPSEVCHKDGFRGTLVRVNRCHPNWGHKDGFRGTLVKVNRCYPNWDKDGFRGH